jgi:tetratricopeptide (TPR) repeat protein
MKKIPARFLLLLLLVVCTFTTVTAKDDWTQVKSKNFFLIGNAPEKDIRKVATRLEQFRETFSLLFKGLKLVSPIGTNVVVFKSDSSFKQFKLKRADGKIDNFLAGYFAPGEDVNYIALSVEGDEVETYRTIFHEYVHFIINTNFGKSEVPPWFNEGLAEFYSTFKIEDDHIVKLGLLIDYHLEMLQHSKLIPLGQLFGVKNRQLLNQGDHSRTIFYAESWALIHYLVQGGKGPMLSKFLDAVLKQVPPEKAFKDVFQEDYATMQKDLEKYVGQSKYQGTQFTFEKKLTFDADMQVTPMTQAMSDAYLGDLLYHAGREDDAEPFLTAALKEDPSLNMASADMGMVKFKQRKFDEARTYLETAVKGQQKSAYALYRYAYLLSREGDDEYGIRHEFSPETIAKMHDALSRAIDAEPSFTESYDLLAFVDLASKTNMEEAARAMETVSKYEPGNDGYALRLAEIYMAQGKYDETRKIADKIRHGSDDIETQRRADRMLQYLDERAKYEQRKAAFEQGRGSNTVSARQTDAPMTQAEIDKVNADAELRSINSSLRGPQEGEKRVIGAIERVDCSRRPIAFTVRTGDQTFILTSADFNSLTLNAFDKAADGVQVGCDSKLAALNAVIGYKEGPPSINNKGPRGQLLAIEFVPKDFRILSDEELADRHPRLVRRTQQAATDTPAQGGDAEVEVARPTTRQPTGDDMRNVQRDAVRQAMRSALRQPAEDEKREIAYLDKIECSSKGYYFIFHDSAGTLRLLNDKPESLHLVYYTRDLDGLQLGCTLKPVEFPAVIVYKPSGDPKGKTQGTIRSVEFVPKDFTLD